MRKQEIYIVSDSTGETAEKLIQACLAQFKMDGGEIQKFIKVQTPEQLKQIISKASHVGAFIVYTFAQKWLRDLMVREIETQKVIAIDILGPIITKFSQYLSRKPEERPGAQHDIDEDYFKRISAMEFSVTHDDGLNLDTVGEADIVLIGVSRTSKTPLSIYLSHESWKVANIPFVPGVIYDLDVAGIAGKAVGLVIDPVHLVDIRKARLKQMKEDVNSTYARLETIYDEINQCLEFCRKHRIPVVEVTRKSIEETASEILKVLNKDKISY